MTHDKMTELEMQAWGLPRGEAFDDDDPVGSLEGPGRTPMFFSAETFQKMMEAAEQRVREEQAARPIQGGFIGGCPCGAPPGLSCNKAGCQAGL